LIKVNEIGNKINYIDKVIEDIWDKLHNSNMEIPKI